MDEPNPWPGLSQRRIFEKQKHYKQTRKLNAGSVLLTIDTDNFLSRRPHNTNEFTSVRRKCNARYTHWRQSRLSPIRSNQQHLKFNSLSRSTLSPTRSTLSPVRSTLSPECRTSFRLCRQCVRRLGTVDFVANSVDFVANTVDSVARMSNVLSTLSPVCTAPWHGRLC